MQAVILSKLGISFPGCKDSVDSGAELKTPAGPYLHFRDAELVQVGSVPSPPIATAGGSGPGLQGNSFLLLTLQHPVSHGPVSCPDFFTLPLQARSARALESSRS